jgi:hypothetical protein
METPFTESPNDLKGSSHEPGFAAPVFSQLVVNVEPGVQAPVFSRLFRPGDLTGPHSQDRRDPPPPPRHAGADAPSG